MFWCTVHISYLYSLIDPIVHFLIIMDLYLVMYVHAIVLQHLVNSLKAWTVLIVFRGLCV